VVVYAVFLSLDLGYMSMQWDEVNHFTGGLLLTRGQLQLYVETSSFYPPVMNLVTAAYFAVAGASVFVGRLVAVTFSVLSALVVYEIANRMYGPKTALVSTVMFGVMPGIVWVSRMAMIETMLIFTFSVSMLFFFKWLSKGRERDRLISIAAFAIGVAVKYQTLVLAPVIMIVSLIVFGKSDYLKAQIRNLLRSWRLIVLVVAATLAALLVYALLASGLMGTWIYAIQTGTAERSLYSVRFPTPIFYFVEMTWPLGDMHPISLLLYVLGLSGLGLFAYRRKPEDKFLLIWFIMVYVVFTLIPNRHWRYVTLLFPVLAISASHLAVSAVDKAQKVWRNTNARLNRKLVAKLAAASLVVFLAVGVSFSCMDAYSWVEKDRLQVPVEQATEYALQRLSQNQSVMVACPLNLLNKYMVWFYLTAKTSSQYQVWEYPELAVDAYTPIFNTTEFVGLCQQHNVKYVFLYEVGAAAQYFNSTLTPWGIYSMLNSTGRLTPLTPVGTEPYRIFILSFS
jgi:4-amino-4-deoxy-L-arabinose transferase-like glycosyltransferase